MESLLVTISRLSLPGLRSSAAPDATAPVPDRHAAAPSPRRGPAPRSGPHGVDPARRRAAPAHLDRRVPPGDVCGTLLPDHGWVCRAVLWGVHPSVIGRSVDGVRLALRRLCSISRFSFTLPTDGVCSLAGGGRRQLAQV